MTETTTLRDGRKARLRPLDQRDRERLRRTFEGLSPESRYRRFFLPLRELRDEHLDYLVNVDHRDHEAIAAVDPQSGEILGVARYVRLGEEADRAEASVAVVDGWQHQGLGRALLEQLVNCAREQDITRFAALVQADNRRAVELLSQIGPTTRSLDGNVVELDIALPDEGLGSSLAVALRGAAGALLGTRPLAERIAHRAKGMLSQAHGWSGLHGSQAPDGPRGGEIDHRPPRSGD